MNNLNLAEGELKHKWTPPTKAALKKADYPKDYFVPNLGVDQDIIDTQAHIASQQTKQNHEWKPEQDENGVWIVPEASAARSYRYGVRNDKPNASYVQTDAEIKTESDPVCPSSGCNYASEKGKKTHPMNYFVPNFG